MDRVTGALARVQDIEALANEIETLCTQLEAARAEISDERQRREEAEDLLRKVKKTLANHIAADRIREEVFPSSIYIPSVSMSGSSVSVSTR
jgi:hypothetical protein